MIAGVTTTPRMRAVRPQSRRRVKPSDLSTIPQPLHPAPKVGDRCAVFRAVSAPTPLISLMGAL
ncbi:hypothetical protein SEA_CLOWN_61 [Gordonia phage Clown]|uniref:Uncharacterized protein n=1 Tax=Gordonia phage Clown TaxID=2759393 RepID=A0A7L7STM1_9CAUD|nr:hypothetical protein KNV25_gp61 [Gordonia phage Clown]QOC56059.1 hypothetical protein SEA_CLOWN_61 [Gordonia phage Clown]